MIATTVASGNTDMSNILKWDQRFMDLAALVANWSKDPSTKVGAVIVRPDRTIVSVGYNGFPRGVWDDSNKLSDRNEKYPRTVHAEANAILTANESVKDCTLYVTPLFPCATCAGLIIQAGIKEVNYMSKAHDTGWEESFRVSREMFDEAGVGMTFHGVV